MEINKCLGPIATWVALFLSLSSFRAEAQDVPNRYKAPVFDQVEVTNNIQFSTNVPRPRPGGGFYEFVSGLPINVREWQTDPVNLRMDIYQPQGDTLQKRPLVIICFGGGFVTGSRTHWSIVLLAQELARRGFVTAAIDYRLGMNLFNQNLGLRAVYRGIQDGRSAVRFFRADADGANNYRIDPEQIYMGGHSAGAFVALHNAYLDKETERPASTYTWTQSGNPVPDQLCLDCVGDNQAFEGHANAIFSLAGAVGFTSYLETAEDPNLVMFHSTDDGTVPYTSGEPFGSISGFIIGSDLPTVYGSQPISERADEIELPYEFYSYTNRGHGVHEDGSSSLYSDIVPNISTWFDQRQLMPFDTELIGPQSICSPDTLVSYFFRGQRYRHLDWQIEGGTFLQSSPYDTLVLVRWNPSATNHVLRVIPYSMWGSRGDTLQIIPNFDLIVENKFLGPNMATWHDPDHWSLGRIPLPCDDVIIPNEGTPRTVTMNPASKSVIHSLLIESQNLLHQYGQLSLLFSGGITVEGKMVIHDSVYIFRPKSYVDTNLKIFGEVENEGLISMTMANAYGLHVQELGSLLNQGQIFQWRPNADDSTGAWIEGMLENNGLIHITGGTSGISSRVGEQASWIQSMGSTLILD